MFVGLFTKVPEWRGALLKWGLKDYFKLGYLLWFYMETLVHSCFHWASCQLFASMVVLFSWMDSETASLKWAHCKYCKPGKQPHHFPRAKPFWIVFRTADILKKNLWTKVMFGASWVCITAHGPETPQSSAHYSLWWLGRGWLQWSLDDSSCWYFSHFSCLSPCLCWVRAGLSCGWEVVKAMGILPWLWAEGFYGAVRNQI